MRTAFLSLLLLVTLASSSPGFGIRSWTYAELMAEADAVVIVSCLGTAPTQAEYPEGNDGAALQGARAVLTTFKIEAVLKSDLKPLGELRLLHFAAGGMSVVNYFPIDFPTGKRVLDGRSFDSTRAVATSTAPSYFPVWLAFLKRRADGNYEPVTGQRLPSTSFRELQAQKQPDGKLVAP